MKEELSVIQLVDILRIRILLLDKKLTLCMDPVRANRLMVELSVIEEILTWLKKAREKMKKRKDKRRVVFHVPLKLASEEDKTVFYNFEGAKEFAARINSVVLNSDGSLYYMPGTDEVLKYNKDHLNQDKNP